MEERARAKLRERFYRSVAETLALLHAAPDRDPLKILVAVAGILASTMRLPLVWIGRREPGCDTVQVVAAAGRESAYASKLELSADEAAPGGGGPVGLVLRQQQARVTPVDAPEFAPWREAAREHGFGSCIAAASRTLDDGQLLLVAYSHDDGPGLSDELLEWGQRLVDELARAWNHHVMLQRGQRISRYRNAQRTIQRALLDQPDPDGVYRTLANALAEVAGAAAVDVFAADGDDGMLRRVALIGPIKHVMLGLPMPSRHESGPLVPAPTQAFMQGTPVILRRLDEAVRSGAPWRGTLYQHAGSVGCWPLFATTGESPATARTPSGVFVVANVEPDAFDDEMCRLLDEVADAAGLALGQHAQRNALLQEQQRQTYLATHDDLTGLPNRRALDLYLDALLMDARREGRQLAVGLLDLDDLKPINDVHGHAVGDRILMEVAERFRQVLRTEDYVARLGGDEFVLVFRDLQQISDLDDLLERVGASLHRPMRIKGDVFTIGASLGIASYSAEAGDTGELLLRRADQAMYQVKARKRDRSRWWGTALPDGLIEPANDPEAAVVPYGEEAAALLTACGEIWQSQLAEVVERFHANLQLHEGIVRLLNVLPVADIEALQGHIRQHLDDLMRPDLSQENHQAKAAQTGLFHAACGLEEVWLLEVIEQLRDILADGLTASSRLYRRALAVLLQRVRLERQWQLESMRELQRRRVSLLGRINAMAWSADSYLQLIQGVVDALVSHEEIVACAASRPDPSGELTYEAVAGVAFAKYLYALGAGQAPPISVRDGTSDGLGPSGRAWRTGVIQRCAHYATDPLMAGWRDLALRLGVVSSVAIPLSPTPAYPAVLLTVYSAYAGGMQGEDQQAFVGQIKTVLDLALARLAPPRQGAELLPFFVREQWRAMISTDALQMHYQPLVRLKDGQVAELEALARLRDTDGALLVPGRFLPALGADDLLALFGQGLRQAVACRESLLRVDQELDVSVNIPAAALEDVRYAAVLAAVLASTGCPAQALLLEVLESPIGTEHDAVLHGAGMQSLRALGVRLVEDDLGAGYSSLIRLRQWPFHRIKIDQAIVLQARQDPLGTLRFMRQLIRIGHDLQLEVVVEGLESLDLVEAATILGADFGQGYALAWPMPADALPGWLADYRNEPHEGGPRTALGALAGELRWEEQFVALPPKPAFWAAHADSTCEPGEYLHDSTLSPALDASHRAMHNAAAAGPADPLYRSRRAAFLALLVEHVLEGWQPQAAGPSL